MSNWPTTKLNNKDWLYIKLLYEHEQIQKLKDKIPELEGESPRSTRSLTLQRNRRMEKVNTTDTDPINDDQTELELCDDVGPAPANMSTKFKRSCDKGKWTKKKKFKMGRAQQPSKKEEEGVPPCADCLTNHKEGKYYFVHFHYFFKIFQENTFIFSSSGC